VYKGASASLVRRTHVDRPHPTNGYIDAGPDQSDVLASVGAMSNEGLTNEQASLRRENAQAQQALAIAKAEGDQRRVIGIGQTLQTLNARASLVKAEIKRRNISGQNQPLEQAIKELAPELASSIFQRANEIRIHGSGGGNG
jgi:hypothetical protein